MRNITQLEEFYQTNLKQNLATLEEARKSLLKRYLIGILGIIGSFASFILLANLGNGGVNAFFLLPIAVIIFSVVVMIRTTKSNKIYRTEYKTKIVAEIVKLINPELKYESDRRISSIDYANSDLFRTRYDKYDGDDFISGVIEKTDFQCSELHTQYKSETTNSNGKRESKWITIFKGLFFHADFNKEFSGKTYVAPDSAEKIFGKFGQRFQKYSGKAKLVKLENMEFEREYVVHSTDQIEARYIITPAIMEAMLRIKQKYKRPAHFSFIGTRVYCAISFNKNLFEPRIFKSGVKLSDIENMYNLFMMNETIIKELNLNTRIWTKD